MLPADPVADVLTIDYVVQEWWKTDRSPPYGGSVPDLGEHSRVTSESGRAALIRTRWWDVEPLSRTTPSWRCRGRTIGFLVACAKRHDAILRALRPIVAMTWTLVSLQKEVQERWALSGPFEVTVALRGSRGGGISHFAEGWRDPSQDFGFMEVRTCLDQHVLLRMEIEDGFEPQDVATQIGDRVENAFGTTHRRHIANRGDFEGRFDPRFTF